MDRLLLLGVGSVARAVRSALSALPALGSTRQAPDARFADITPIAAEDERALRDAATGARVVVSFPPDGHTDRAWAALVQRAAQIVYLSSTAVYSSASNVVSETTPVAAENERARLRLDAEAAWLAVGASVVRLPALYGPDTGLHLSLARGSFRLPGAGANIVSRVHVADAARFVIRALSAEPGSILLAGDDEPAKVAEVVAFVCSLFELAPPAVAEGNDIPLSLRASRAVDNSATKQRYDVKLAYPTYREGYRAIHAAEAGPGAIPRI